MGFAYFASPAKSRQKKSHLRKEAVRKHSEVRVHIKKDMFLQNSLVIENVRISSFLMKTLFSTLVSERLKVKEIINQIMCHNVLI